MFAPFTTYWDLMTAVNRTPSFCNGTIGPMYSQNSPIAMCAKEAAGMVATLITSSLPEGIMDETED